MTTRSKNKIDIYGRALTMVKFQGTADQINTITDQVIQAR